MQGQLFCEHLHQQFYSLGRKFGVPNIILNGFILGLQYLIMVHTGEASGITLMMKHQNEELIWCLGLPPSSSSTDSKPWKGWWS